MFYIENVFQCQWWYHLSQLITNINTPCTSNENTNSCFSDEYSHVLLTFTEQRVNRRASAPHSAIPFGNSFLWPSTVSASSDLDSCPASQLLCARRFRSWTERYKPLNNSDVDSIMGLAHMTRSLASHRRGLALIRGPSVWDLWWTKCTGAGFFSQVIQVSPVGIILSVLDIHSFIHWSLTSSLYA
jgi:hypothetical protein